MAPGGSGRGRPCRVSRCAFGASVGLPFGRRAVADFESWLVSRDAHPVPVKGPWCVPSWLRVVGLSRCPPWPSPCCSRNRLTFAALPVGVSGWLARGLSPLLALASPGKSRPSRFQADACLRRPFHGRSRRSRLQRADARSDDFDEQCLLCLMGHPGGCSVTTHAQGAAVVRLRVVGPKVHPARLDSSFRRSSHRALRPCWGCMVLRA